jgi:flagella basal body P-ring formation protein FlgA
MMSLSTQGKASEAGGIGDVIRVINTSSKTAVFAEIIGPQKVRVTSRQMAMQ